MDNDFAPSRDPSILAKAHASPMGNYRLFLDLDGVLADFDAGVLAVTGSSPAELGDSRMWPILARTPGFYDRLPWMTDGPSLWDFAKAYNPAILTGLPRGKWAEPQKRTWCARELGPEVTVLCCMTRDKPKVAMELSPPGCIPVLVDDRLKVQEAWEAMGGIFILHTSAASSIEALTKLLSHS